VKLDEIKIESEDRAGGLFGAFIVRVAQELKSSLADVIDHVSLEMEGPTVGRRARIVAHLPADAEEDEARLLSSLLHRKLSAMARSEHSPDLRAVLEKAAASAYYNAEDWGDPATAYFVGATIWLPEVTNWLGYIGSQTAFNRAVDAEVKKSTWSESVKLDEIRGPVPTVDYSYTMAGRVIGAAFKWLYDFCLEQGYEVTQPTASKFVTGATDTVGVIMDFNDKLDAEEREMLQKLLHRKVQQLGDRAAAANGSQLKRFTNSMEVTDYEEAAFLTYAHATAYNTPSSKAEFVLEGLLAGLKGESV
jgi:hypothetical protein